MNSSNEIPKKKSFWKKGVLIGTVLFAIVSLFMFAIITNMLKDTYLIKFYDDEYRLGSYRLDIDERVDDEILDEVISKVIDDGNEYLYYWSFENGTLDEVDFSLIDYDSNIYLYKVLKVMNEYSIDVIETGKFKYELISDDVIYENSSAILKVENLVLDDRYKMQVFANGIELYENKVGEYHINNICEDVVIEIVHKEILSISDKLNDSYVYDANPLNIDYEVLDFDGFIKDVSEIDVCIYDSDNNLLDEIIDVGEYRIVFKYMGDDYYIEDYETNVSVTKAYTIINVLSKTVVYNALVHSYDISDVITNSDGVITFENNENINAGVYEVIINISETDNYYPSSTSVSLVILKADPTLSSSSFISTGYEGDELSSVGIKSASSNVSGEFKWKNNNEELKLGLHQYEAIFVPKDSLNYNEVSILINVQTISNEETLRRIRIDKFETQRYVDSVIGTYLDLESIEDLNNLPIVADSFGSKITWFSDNNVLRVDSSGEFKLIGDEGLYEINLIGYVNLGNAIEYISIEFTLDTVYKVLEIDDDIKDVDYIVNEVSEKVIKIITLEDFEKVYSKKKKEKEINTETNNYKLEVLYDYSSLESNENIEDVCMNKQTYVSYELECIYQSSISEIILWSILKDSGGYLKFNNHFVLNICKEDRIIMKGDKCI